MNLAIISGRLVRDPELKYLPNGRNSVCKFTLAVDKQLSNEKKEEIKAKGGNTADFINVTAWGKLGETAANYLNKGNKCLINGKIVTGNYDDKDGKKIYTTDVVANQVEFLEWGDKKEGFKEDFQAPDGFNSSSNDDIPF